MITIQGGRRIRSIATFGVLSILILVLLYSAPRNFVSAAGEKTYATFRNGTLHIHIPYDEAMARSRMLDIQVLAVDDKPMAATTRAVAPTRDAKAWDVALILDKSVTVEDLVWQRVRIGSQIISLSEILRLPIIRLHAQRAYAAGSRASLRVIAAGAKGGEPLGDSDISVELLNGETANKLYKGRTNRIGTVEIEFDLPSGSYGARTLRITADTPLGTITASQPIQIERRNKILLTADKPQYQPGQTIHLRALALDGPTRMAATDQPMTLEIEDAKGNKVFKRRGKTDRFGIASATFELADEVNLGAYHVRALLGEGDAVYTQEKTITVDRYVLPKFKVDIELNRDGARQQQTYYSPGETVEGKVAARYLFGKPLVNASVRIILSSFDVATTELARIEGKTNADGHFTFQSKLPNFLAGSSTNQGSAQVAIAAEVKDTADHTETKSKGILVSNTPILILAVPESGQLLPHIENQVFILTSYPDGTPAKTTVSVPDSSTLTTDDSGVAVLPVRLQNTAPLSLKLKAVDAQGRAGETTTTLQPRAQTQSLMVRTNKAVLKVGDKLSLQTISTRERGAVYIDVVKDGQTLLTRAIETEEGQGRLEVDLIPEMFGAVEVRAYQFTADADPIVDRKLVYVDPADDLRLTVSAERENYRPGEDARINFRATDAGGRPVSAALGVEIVDEAVFALSDKQPGFEKVFLHLQKELLTPRYEIHQFSFEQVVLDTFDGEIANRAGKRERAAQVLLAAAGPVTDRDARGTYGTEAYDSKRSTYIALFTQRIAQTVQPVIPALTKYYEVYAPAKAGFGRDLQLFGLTDGARNISLVDPWGNKLTGDGAFPAGYDQTNFSLRSSGPDKQQGTADDIALIIHAQRKQPLEKVRNTPFKGSVAVVEGIIPNEKVQIEGFLKDERGIPVANAKVLGLRVTDGKAVWVYSDAQGRFVISDLEAGRYRISFDEELHHRTQYRDLLLNPGSVGKLELTLTRRGPTAVALTLYNGNYGLDGLNAVNEMAIVDRVVVAGAARLREPQLRKMKDLPINGRRANENLLAMSPGATTAADRDAEDDVIKVGSGAKEDQAGGPRVRSYFPETLYTNPALITDGDGQASVSVPLADSITTWRITSLASTTNGALGSSTAPLRVFQDFFIDLDLPVSITEGDEVSVPVAVYNYLPSPQSVSLTLRQDPWFTLQEGEASNREVQVKAGEVTVIYFRLKASKIGEQQLQVTGHLGGERAGSAGDAVARNITVMPNGEERLVVHNDRLEGQVTKEIAIPEDSIADASRVFVKFYPGALSQMVEGLDSILRMPGGCFEQTSSSTYPNVLVLDYLKTSKKLTPEIQAKAEGYISLGYQKLVTFEVRGGGFSWFGEAPANKILTAYGLMEFSDMSHVHEVDPRVIERTQQWLVSQQQPDGSFKPDTYFINEGATNRYNTDVVRITAYIGWALASSGFKGEAVGKARRFVETHLNGKEDAYTLAVIANFAADSNLDKSWTNSAIEALASRSTGDGKSSYWKQDGETPTSAREDSADLETTALAVQALLKSGQRGDLAKRGLDYLTSKKDALGNWQTTQATILALKAFLLSHTKGSNADTEGSIDVSVDGRQAGTVKVTTDNNDVLQMVDLKQFTHAGTNRISLSFTGRGSMQYQLVGRYYIPWARLPAQGDRGKTEPLSISLNYDRTRLAQDEMVTARVRVQNNTNAKAKMVMIDLGIPPGFEPLGEDFAEFLDVTRGKAGGKLEKYTITAKQIILYMDGLNARQVTEFTFRLRAKFPVRTQTASSRVYEYYNPSIGARTRPATLIVVAK